MYDELTQVDIDKMKAELEHRRLELRPKLIEDVQTARAFGDLSENYEYKVAKQEKNRNESRIRYLERMIATAKVIEVNEKEGTVGLFDHVVLYNEKLGKEQNIQLVTTLRQNALKGLISKESPVGKAVMGHKKGDRVTTIGGMVGRIVQVNDTTVVFETSEDRVRIEVAKWGIQSTESMEAAAAQKGKKSVPAKKDEKKEEEPAAKAEEPKTVEAAEVPAAKEEQKEEKPGYDPEIK